jgi:hypothetical protein
VLLTACRFGRAGSMRPFVLLGGGQSINSSQETLRSAASTASTFLRAKVALNTIDKLEALRGPRVGLSDVIVPLAAAGP